MATTAVVAGTAAHMGAKSAQRSAAADQDQAPPALLQRMSPPHPKPPHPKPLRARRSNSSNSLPPSKTRASSPRRSSAPRRHRSWGS